MIKTAMLVTLITYFGDKAFCADLCEDMAAQEFFEYGQKTRQYVHNNLMKNASSALSYYSFCIQAYSLLRMGGQINEQLYGSRSSAFRSDNPGFAIMQEARKKALNAIDKYEQEANFFDKACIDYKDQIRKLENQEKETIVYWQTVE